MAPPCCVVPAATGAALREFWSRSGSGEGGPASIRDFAVVDTLGHGDYGSVFEVGWAMVQGVVLEAEWGRLQCAVLEVEWGRVQDAVLEVEWGRV